LYCNTTCRGGRENISLSYFRELNGCEFFDRRQQREQRRFIHRILCSLRYLLFPKFLLAAVFNDLPIYIFNDFDEISKFRITLYKFVIY